MPVHPQKDIHPKPYRNLTQPSCNTTNDNPVEQSLQTAGCKQNPNGPLQIWKCTVCPAAPSPPHSRLRPSFSPQPVRARGSRVRCVAALAASCGSRAPRELGCRHRRRTVPRGKTLGRPDVTSQPRLTRPSSTAVTGIRNTTTIWK